MDKASYKNEQWKLAETKMPSPPTTLPGEARAEWRRIQPYLTALGRVAEVDRQALHVYCTQYSHFARLMREEFSNPTASLSASGPTCEVMHPLLPPLLRSGDIVVKIAGQFGMTARTRDLGSGHGNRKASSIKKLMGNQRKVAQHKLEDGVVQLLPDWSELDMTPPGWLNQIAREEYERLGEQLKHLDLFTPLDVATLSVGCALFELYDRAVGQLTNLYTEVTNRDGETVSYKEHPLQKASTEIYKLLNYIWKDYGQTPRFRRVFDGESRQDETRKAPLVFKGRA